MNGWSASPGRHGRAGGGPVRGMAESHGPAVAVLEPALKLPEGPRMAAAPNARNRTTASGTATWRDVEPAEPADYCKPARRLICLEGRAVGEGSVP